MKTYKHSLVATLFCLSFNALLQADEPHRLQSMTIISSTAPKSIYEIPASVWYIDGEEIEKEYKQGQSLSNILASKIPALDLSSDGRTNYGQNLRGRGMLVMIDGVSLNSARKISRQLDSIDPFNIDHIEVLSGASSVYGTGASGGIINIITKNAKSDKLEFESFAGLTSGLNSSEDFDYKLAQSISGGNEFVKGRFGIVYGETKARYDGKKDLIVPDITQGSLQYNKNIDIIGSLNIKPSDKENLNILAQYYNSEQDMPSGIYFGENLSGILNRKPNLIYPKKGFMSDRQAKTTRKMLNASYDISDILGGQTLYSQLSYRDEKLNFLPFPRGSFFSASSQKTDVMSAKLALSKQFTPLALTYGLSGYIEDFTSNQMIMDPRLSAKTGGLSNKKLAIIGRYPNTQISSLALFVQGDYDINDKLALSGGYRYQYMKNTIDDFVGVDEQSKIAIGRGKSADMIRGEENDYGINLFNLGLTYKMSQNSSIWANFSQGFDLPDPARYYGNGVYERKADKNGHYKLKSVYDVKLRGIKTNSYEIGARYSDGVLDMQGSIYYTFSDKSVQIKTDKTNFRIYEKDEDNKIYGAEVLASYFLTNQFQIGASAHLVKSQIKANGKWKDLSVMLASPSKMTSWASWQDDNFALKVASKTLFDLDDSINNKIDGYTTLDLSASYKIGKGTLSFGIENLLNKDYTTIWGQRAQALYGSFAPKKIFDFKGRGRAFTLSYNIKY